GSRVNIDASSLRSSAKKSIGENNEAVTLEIKMLIEYIELLASNRQNVDKKRLINYSNTYKNFFK
ncbi:hypothetical protein BGU97_18260, partial [Clostridioides difficile]|uniref:hypothetical protein n=1 Tax=Clostridioides difficile TaxID=1496 RepID=UPI000BC4461A